jgi:thiol-disulfide isomerase/thioredoxin/archaellin
MNNPINTTMLRLAAVFFVVLLGCGNKTPEQTEAQIVQSERNTSSGIASLQAVSYSDNIMFTAEEQSENGFVLKGEVNGFNGVVYLHELTPSKLDFKDSASTDANGQFVMKGSFTEPTLCFLTFGSPNPPGIPVVLSSNKLGLTISFGDIISFSTNGDKDNELMSELYGIYASHDLAMYRFNKEVQNIDPATASDSLKASIQTRFNQMSKKRMDDITAFVKTKKGSPATYFATTYLYEEPTIDLLQAAYDNMNKAVPSSKYTSAIKSQIDQVGPLDIGGLAPDIALNSPDGKVVKLSSLRGKVVLIDFWASWCRPCRMENPNVKRVYDLYKDKGFEIYGVSLDKEKSRWVSAIEADGLSWLHVSDLKGWQNAAAQRYMVNSIPFTVLLDKNGRIIAKGLRSQALEQKLAEIFN